MTNRSPTDQKTLDGYRDLAVRDARTIADLSEQNAALLAALERVLAGIVTTNDGGSIDAARAAIARAKGEE